MKPARIQVRLGTLFYATFLVAVAALWLHEVSHDWYTMILLNGEMRPALMGIVFTPISFGERWREPYLRCLVPIICGWYLATRAFRARAERLRRKRRAGY